MKNLVPALLALTFFAGSSLAAEGDTKPAPRPKHTAAVFSPAPSGWYAELRTGFATQQLDDPNSNIAYMERIGTYNLGSPGALRRFGEANAFALELGHRRGNWSWGLATEHQRQRVRSFTAGTNTGALDLITLMGVTDVRLTTSVRPAKFFGFELGASAGMAFAHYSEQYAIYVFPAPEFNAALSGVYHASSPSAGAHIGWRRPLYGNTWLVARGAWAYRKFDSLQGSQTGEFGPGTTSYDLVRLDNGKKASIDATGFQFTTGLSHTFGGRR
jgi:hypothetical protein